MNQLNYYECKNVSKRYGNLTALDNVDFHIGKNEVVGLLGDNGAGKSTLIKMMSGVVAPDTGNVFVDGKETKIYQTNHILRSVQIPPGNSEVVFRYNSLKWERTRILSRVSLLIVLVLAGLSFVKEKRAKKT